MAPISPAYSPWLGTDRNHGLANMLSLPRPVDIYIYNDNRYKYDILSLCWDDLPAILRNSHLNSGDKRGLMRINERIRGFKALLATPKDRHSQICK